MLRRKGLPMEASGGRVETQHTVLVAIEPRAYREAVGRAIETLRPKLFVKTVEQGMLSAEILRTNPTLVLCDGAVDGSVDGVPNRVIFRDDESAASVRLRDRQVEMDRVDLDDLLSIVDRAVSSTHEGTRDDDTHDGSKTSESMEE